MGPLHGVKIIELGGIGPAPFCGMLLADLGADVLRVERIQPPGILPATEPRFDLFSRGKQSISLDLKQPGAIALLKKLLAGADALIEGFRPGVAERMGLGPETCEALNPRLVYGRMTGWGQIGPLAQAPGHDINYIAVTGALHAIGQKDGPPIPPLNLVGDFGGGAMYLALGLLSALLESRSSGRGQVVDAAMVDGAASLMTFIYGLHAAGRYSDHRGTNRYDGGAPYYATYETKDGRWIALGSNEPRFYQATLELLGLAAEPLPEQTDRTGWDTLGTRFAAVFETRTRDEWCALAVGKEVCLSPVLSLEEAPNHPSNQERGTFLEIDGVPQPAPAPRFSRTAANVRSGPAADPRSVLAAWGLGSDEVAALQAAHALG